MSGSGAYEYSYEDRERDACRSLRGQLAEIRARREGARARLRRLSCDTAIEKIEDPGADADSTVLAETVARGLAAVDKAERRADEAQTERLLSRLKTAPRRAQGDRTAPAPAESEGRIVGRELPKARQETLQIAERLLHRDGPRCAPEELDELSGLVDDIRAAPSVDLVRQGLDRLESRMARSIRTRCAAEENAAVRARLRVLVQGAAPERRQGLLAELDTAADLTMVELAAVGERIEEAVADADREHLPSEVAAIAADALRAIGCDVGEDFTTVVGSEQGVVVPIRGTLDPRYYRLLVRLDPVRRQIVTAVVRAPDRPTDRIDDVAAQQRYCDEGFQDRLREELRSRGAKVLQHTRLEPGMLPVRSAPGTAWKQTRTSGGSSASGEEGRAH